MVSNSKLTVSNFNKGPMASRIGPKWFSLLLERKWTKENFESFMNSRGNKTRSFFENLRHIDTNIPYLVKSNLWSHFRPLSVEPPFMIQSKREFVVALCLSEASIIHHLHKEDRFNLGSKRKRKLFWKGWEKCNSNFLLFWRLFASERYSESNW